MILFASSPLLGDEFPIRRIAAPGDASLGSVVNPSGENINGGGEVAFVNGFSVFRWKDEQLTLVLERDQETDIPVSTGGSNFLWITSPFSVPRLDLGGRARLFSKLKRGFSTYGSALWTIPADGERALVARSDDDLPDLADTVWDVEWDTPPLIVSSGGQDLLLFELIRQRPTGEEDQVYARASGSGGLETVVAVSAPAPGTGGTFFRLDDMEMNPDAEVLFQARVETEDQQQFDSIWRFVGSELQVIARQGMATPEGGTFASVSRPQVDESSQSYFFGETDEGVQGIWAGTAPEDLAAIIETGIRMTAAGGDVTLREIKDFEVAGNGVVFLKAETTLHSFSTVRLDAILKLKEGQLEVLAHERGATPDGNTWSYFGEQLAVSSDGRLAFSGVSFEGPVWTANITSLWATDSDGQLVPVVVEREPLETTTGTFEPLRSIGVNPGGGSDGRPRSWSDSGELLFGGELESNSFRRALFVAGSPSGPSDLYYWSGEAGDTNWHTRLESGETNWNDETGKTVDPPGALGTEIVHIEDRVEVVVDHAAISVGEIHAGGIFNLLAEVDVSIAGDSVIAALHCKGNLLLNGRLTIEEGNGLKSYLQVEGDIGGDGELVVKNGRFVVEDRSIELAVPVSLMGGSKLEGFGELVLAGGGHFEDSSIEFNEDPTGLGFLRLSGGVFEVSGSVEISANLKTPEALQLGPESTVCLMDNGTLTLDGQTLLGGTVEGSGKVVLTWEAIWESGMIRNSPGSSLVIESYASVTIRGSDENQSKVLGAEWNQRRWAVSQTVPLTLDGGVIQIQRNVNWTLDILDSNTIPHLLAVGSENLFRNLGGRMVVYNRSGEDAVLRVGPSFDNLGFVVIDAGRLPDDPYVDVSFVGPVAQVQEGRLIGGYWGIDKKSVLRMPGRSIRAIDWPGEIRLLGEFPELNLTSNGAVLEVGTGRTMQTEGDFQNSESGTLSVKGKVEAEGILENDGELETIMTEIESVIVVFGMTSNADTPAFANGIRATTLSNNGVLLPGGRQRPGVLPMDGDLLLNASGILEIDLGGTEPHTEHDQVFATGAVTLGGTLLIGDTNGFVPEIGATFRVLQGSTVTGHFDAILNRSAGRIVFDVAYEADGVTVTALPWIARTFETWAAGMFTAEEMADPAISGPEADPDGDSLTNRLEYVMATNPHRRSHALFQIATEQTEGKQILLSFPWVRELQDTTYRLEWSQDLKLWQEMESSFIQTSVETRGEVDHISARFSALDEGSTRFYRLSARY